MPMGTFMLRAAVADVHGDMHGPGAIETWNDLDPDNYLGAGMTPPAWLAPGLVILNSPVGATPKIRGKVFAKSAISLAAIVQAQIGSVSQYFCAGNEAREVDLTLPVGAKLRYRIGTVTERASRTAADSLSTLVTGAGAVVEIPLQRGDVLHLICDASQAAPVDVTMAFVLWHGD